METSPVLFDIQQGIGWITLNRPKVLNSLNTDMVKSIKEQLEKWKDNTDVAMICVVGAGEKGLCAGGDIRDLYDHRSSNMEDHAEQFFATEYMMDYAFSNFPKPVLVYMDGVVMGGGVGISVGASHRIVTEKTKWAMPEMNIGFFPDVGSSYFLNRLPGAIGKYLALTSSVITTSDVMELGYGDYYISQEDWPKLKQALGDRQWTVDQANQELHELIATFARTNEEPSALLEKKDKIDKHFSFDTVEAIVKSLEQASEREDDWEHKTKETLLSKSPTSLKVTLEQQQRGKDLTYAASLRMELDVAMNFMNHGDFYEGVRSVLVDKDKSPKWSPASLEEVPDESVEAFFQYQWSNGENPLKDIEKEISRNESS